MTNVERFKCVLNGKKPDDRMPVYEWAPWWTLTLERWANEGLPLETPRLEKYDILGLDKYTHGSLGMFSDNAPSPKGEGKGIISDLTGYKEIKKYLYPKDGAEKLIKAFDENKRMHESGELIYRIGCSGAFWFPRLLLGIENHLYSFYDECDLYKRIVHDMLEFEMEQLEMVFKEHIPEYVTIAEDMSYNHGPMISEEMFDEFMAPFYRELTNMIHKYGIKIFVDSDGDVTQLLPWLERVDVDGVLPLEFQAGVDICRIRKDHPELLMMGGYNKLIMKDGEEAMRKEFERVLPVMKSGRYISSVDHQTPPDVSLTQYRSYVSLLKEYAIKAVRE